MKKKSLSDSDILRFIGGELAVCRRERGFSQQDLGEISHISADRVGVIERGHRNYDMLTVSNLYLNLECGGIIVDNNGFVPLRDRIKGAMVLSETAVIQQPSMISLMGKAVHDTRKAYGLTLAELAQDSRLHLNSLWYFEKGLVVPGICSYFRLLQSLQISLITVENGTAVFHNK